MVAVAMVPCFKDASLGYPTLPETNIFAKSVKIYPSECREKGMTYQAPLSCTFQFMTEDRILGSVSRVVGMVPVMVKVREGRGMGIDFTIRCRLYFVSLPFLLLPLPSFVSYAPPIYSY